MISSIRGVPAIDLERRSAGQQKARQPVWQRSVEQDRSGAAEGGDMRDVFRQIPGAVALVTAGTGDQRHAAIATSIAPLSIEPPSLLLCLATQPPTCHHGLSAGQRLGVSLLSAQHGALAEHGAEIRRIEDLASLAGAGWTTMPQGSLVIDDALLAFDCTIDEIMERRGQAVVIAEVAGLRAQPADCALIYWRGQYERIGWTGAEIARATGRRP